MSVPRSKERFQIVVRKILITVFVIASLLCSALAFTACNNKRTQPPPAHTHNYLWVDNGDGTHKQHCSADSCDVPDIDRGSHDFSDGNCICGKAKPVSEHSHFFGDWISDGEITHTHICSCGESETENHSWNEGTLTTPPSCKNVGLKTYTCTVCNETKTESIDKLTTHTFTRESAEEKYLKTYASCTNRAVYYKSCSVCGAKGEDTFEYGEVTEHPFMSWSDNGDDGHIRFCSCGAYETKPHNFSDGNCVCGKAKPIVPTDGLEFELNYNDPNSYGVEGIGTATDVDIVIPSVYNGKPVTRINGYAFKNNATIESVTIPDSVLHIGNDAFINCVALKSITVGSGIRYIDNDVFADSYIETASIPAILVKYVNNAKLKAVRITSGVAIVDSALKDCKELANLIIGGTVTTIGQKAFQNCGSLAGIDIPDSVESIGDYAFDGCNSLLSISVGENNPNYASQDGILYNKTKTEFVHVPKAISGKVVIPDGITSIDGWFGGCNSLTEIILPSELTSIGLGTFYNCTTLASVTIPDTVTSINEDAFANCSALTDICFNGTKEQWNTVTKNYNWDINTGAYIVHCIDGNIDKEVEMEPEL